jgi:hypothetical protein
VGEGAGVRGRVRERAWVGGEGTGMGGQAKEGAGEVVG